MLQRNGSKEFRQSIHGPVLYNHSLAALAGLSPTTHERECHFDVLPAAAVIIVLLLKDYISGVLRRRRNPHEEIDAEYSDALASSGLDSFTSAIFNGLRGGFARTLFRHRINYRL
jgi:hypothetical protein